MSTVQQQVSKGSMWKSSVPRKIIKPKIVHSDARYYVRGVIDSFLNSSPEEYGVVAKGFREKNHDFLEGNAVNDESLQLSMVEFDDTIRFSNPRTVISKEVMFLLAVDGLMGFESHDAGNYIDALKVGLDSPSYYLVVRRLQKYLQEYWGLKLEAEILLLTAVTIIADVRLKYPNDEVISTVQKHIATKWHKYLIKIGTSNFWSDVWIHHSNNGNY